MGTDGTAAAEGPAPEGNARVLAGRYRLEGRLGRGGMGVVWRATDQLLGRQVAVKELLFDEGDAFGDGGIGVRRERTLREARALAQLGHPHIIGVHDVVEADGRPYIVMELVDGPTLAEQIARTGPVDAREAARIGIALLDALGKAHASGILHRDLKPANVLLETGTGRVVLTDFGVAQVTGATTLTEAGSFLGSPEYTAPERMTGTSAGPESDLWSLGALLCAAVSGTSPFRRNSLSAVLLAVVSDEIRIPGRAAPLLPVVRGLLERDPDRRLDAAQAERMLRVYADTGRVPEPPPGGTPSGRRGQERTRRAALASRLPHLPRSAWRGTSRTRAEAEGDARTAEAPRPAGDQAPDTAGGEQETGGTGWARAGEGAGRERAAGGAGRERTAWRGRPGTSGGSGREPGSSDRDRSAGPGGLEQSPRPGGRGQGPGPVGREQPPGPNGRGRTSGGMHQGRTAGAGESAGAPQERRPSGHAFAPQDRTAEPSDHPSPLPDHPSPLPDHPRPNPGGTGIGTGADTAAAGRGRATAHPDDTSVPPPAPARAPDRGRDTWDRTSAAPHGTAGARDRTAGPRNRSTGPGDRVTRSADRTAGRPQDHTAPDTGAPGPGAVGHPPSATPGPRRPADGTPRLPPAAGHRRPTRATRPRQPSGAQPPPAAPGTPPPAAPGTPFPTAPGTLPPAAAGTSPPTAPGTTRRRHPGRTARTLLTAAALLAALAALALLATVLR